MICLDSTIDQPKVMVDALEEMLIYDPIRKVWEDFGSWQDVCLSARPGEYGVYEISDTDETYALSFLLPFDRRGMLCGRGRVTLEDRYKVIEGRLLSDKISRDIFGEVWVEIEESLPDLKHRDYSGISCEADHRYGVEFERRQALGVSPVRLCYDVAWFQ
ncbi:hypothetical protein LVO79_18860 (plasmid) [Roseivivax marinus]|uniref:hypothetical protein n=1 Tax=Roseivivax marinus TaxID=1379903 RepID=UPI001F04C269|nr:hypothetical protein [Roseivivax marinus]UMA67074.1 hypothetical protein LVO79_18860 [Roseivivax marinus]